MILDIIANRCWYPYISYISDSLWHPCRPLHILYRDTVFIVHFYQNQHFGCLDDSLPLNVFVASSSNHPNPSKRLQKTLGKTSGGADSWHSNTTGLRYGPQSLTSPSGSWWQVRNFCAEDFGIAVDAVWYTGRESLFASRGWTNKIV